MKLSDKVALVTGSARGLGWEIVQAFAEEGARIAICDLAQSDVDQAVAKLGLPLARVLGIKADVTSERDVNDLFCRTLEKFTRLDVLVNNAGFAWPRGGPVNLEVAETPLDVWRKILDTNLNGTFLCSRDRRHRSDQKHSRQSRCAHAQSGNCPRLRCLPCLG